MRIPKGKEVREFRVLAKEWIKLWSIGCGLEGEGFEGNYCLPCRSFPLNSPSWILALGYNAWHHVLPRTAHDSLKYGSSTKGPLSVSGPT